MRAGLADVTVLHSGSDSWQPREPTAKPGICWNAPVTVCPEEKEVEVEVTEVVVQCFEIFFFLQKTSLEVDLQKSFVFLSVLSLLD